MRGLIWKVSAIIFFLDLLLKTYFRFNFAGQSIPLVKNILHLTVVFNKGAAFGILEGKTTFLIYIALVFILILLVFLKKEGENRRLLLFSYGLILGGALSNLFDRAVLGYVVDYIDLRVWPVFNLSDSAISAGAFILFFTSFRKREVKSQSGKI